MSTTLDQLYILHFDGGSQVGPMTRDEWRLAIHRGRMRGVANACRLAGIDRDGAAFGRGYALATVNAIERNGNGVDPLLVQAMRNETRFLLGAYLERGEA